MARTFRSDSGTHRFNVQCSSTAFRRARNSFVDDSNVDYGEQYCSLCGTRLSRKHDGVCPACQTDNKE